MNNNNIQEQPMTAPASFIPDEAKGKWLAVVTLSDAQRLPRRMVAQFLGYNELTKEYDFNLRPLAGTTSVSPKTVLKWHESAVAEPTTPAIYRGSL